MRFMLAGEKLASSSSVGGCCGSGVGSATLVLVGAGVGVGVGVDVEEGVDCEGVEEGAKDAREDASSWASGTEPPFAVKSLEDSEGVAPELRLSCSDSRLVGDVGDVEEGDGDVGVGWT
jgi:hypothetical protein